MRRSKARSLLGLAAILVALVAVPTPATAETVTVGADLQTAVYANAFGCNVEGGCTDAEEAPGFTSPITGTIVRWRVRDSSGALTLRTVGAVGSPLGPTIHPESSDVETFPVKMPIEAGEAIGLDIAKLSGSIGVAEPGGTTLFSWAPALPPGKATPPNNTYTQFELLMNVDVQPPPGIAALTPAAGPAAGGTVVTISGHDFTGATAVRFGSALGLGLPRRVRHADDGNGAGGPARGGCGRGDDSGRHRDGAIHLRSADVAAMQSPEAQGEEAESGEEAAARRRLQDRQGHPEAGRHRPHRQGRQAAPPGGIDSTGGGGRPRQARMTPTLLRPF